MAQELVTKCDGPTCKRRTANERSAIGWLAVEIVKTREQTDDHGEAIKGAALEAETRSLHFHDYGCLTAWATKQES